MSLRYSDPDNDYTEDGKVVFTDDKQQQSWTVDLRNREVRDYEYKYSIIYKDGVVKSFPEDDGWLVGMVLNHAGTQLPVLQVFHAANLTCVASVPLPRRVPAGFHAEWIPASQLTQPPRSSAWTNAPRPAGVPAEYSGSKRRT